MVLYISSYLDADLTDFVSFGDTFYRDIFHRKITKYTCFFIDEVRMCSIVALIVGLAVDTRKTPEESLFCHTLDIAVDSSSSDFWLLFSDFLEYIISREMTTRTGITDDVAVLVGTHRSIMRKNMEKATFIMRIILIIF